MFSIKVIAYNRLKSSVIFIRNRCRCYSGRSSDKNLKVLFFGTDNFSLPSLKLLNNEFENNGVIKGMGVVTSFKSHLNPVKSFAEDRKIALFNYPLDKIPSDFDLGVVVSFGYLIPKEIIDLFPLGMINVHASLLPKWRGAAPIIYTIMNGETVTGVTIMKIHPYHFDVGEIISQVEVKFTNTTLMPELHSKLADTGSKLLLKCIRDLDNSLGHSIPQNTIEASYAPKVTKTLQVIDWVNQTADQVYNLFRALYSYKMLMTRWHGQTIKLVKLEKNSMISSSPSSQFKEPGTVEYLRREKCLVVTCSDQSSIKIETVLMGKKTMTATDFNNGFLKKKPIIERKFE